MNQPNSLTPCLLAIVTLALGATTPAAAQMPAKMKVTHIQTESAAIASGVWAGSTYYLSGQLAARMENGEYGNTEQQSRSSLTKIKNLLAEQGLAMKDVVMMHVYLAGDPANDGKLDFDGMMVAYREFFGTKDQPNKPARSAMQVAALAAPWALVEIEVIAVKSE